MPETGHATKQDLIDEARTLVERLVKVKHKLRKNECEFVLQLDEKLRRYGYGAYVSERQMSWLKILDKQHSLDERQMSLLES